MLTNIRDKLLPPKSPYDEFRTGVLRIISKSLLNVPHPPSAMVLGRSPVGVLAAARQIIHYLYDGVEFNFVMFTRLCDRCRYYRPITHKNPSTGKLPQDFSEIQGAAVAGGWTIQEDSWVCPSCKNLEQARVH